LKSPTSRESEVRDYRWQDFIKMGDVNRLEEISSG